MTAKKLGDGGMGMVSVITAFCIFMTAAVLFYKSTDMAVKMYEKALETDASAEAVIEEYYKNNGALEGKDISIEFKEQKGGGSIAVNGRICGYSTKNGEKLFYFE